MIPNYSSGVTIAGHAIGIGQLPFVVAEMSGNHNQSLERALQIVDAAAGAGVHALKLQTYTPDTMTLDIGENEFFISDPTSLWKGTALYQLYREAHTPWEWHKPIFDRCHKHGLVFFSTPFDATALDFLETLDVPCHKIASFENTDLPLIQKVAATGKPLILSTGMATLAELDESIRAAREVGCKELVLLKCTSSYPASPENSNLRTLPNMRELFQCEVGISDHTAGMGAALAGVSLGATVIEKHFTLRRSDGGVDSAFSMEPAEMQQLVEETKRATLALGKATYGPTDSEKKSLVFRRSLYVAKDMRAGEMFTRDNIKVIRPGCGLPSKYQEVIIGKTITKDAKTGTPVCWSLVGA